MEEVKAPSDLSPEEWKKLGLSLQRALRAAKKTDYTEPLHVTVSLLTEFPHVEGLPMGQERVSSLREAFIALAQPLIEKWTADGGTDFQVHWIAGAVTAKLPLTAVVEAARQQKVVRLDLVEKKKALIKTTKKEDSHG